MVDKQQELQKILQVARAKVISDVREALKSRREYLIFCLRRILATEQGSNNQLEQQEWFPLRSLSELRKFVKARFSTLRDAWCKAGLPLKAHRGDSVVVAASNLEAFEAFKLWLLSRGVELRISSDGSLEFRSHGTEPRAARLEDNVLKHE